MFKALSRHQRSHRSACPAWEADGTVQPVPDPIGSSMMSTSSTSNPHFKLDLKSPRMVAGGLVR